MHSNSPSADRTTAPTASGNDAGPDAVVPDTDVGDAEDVYRCPYCDRPFSTIRLRTLHVGEVHADRATAEEHDVFEKARELEADDLFYFHIKIVIALGALYAMSAIGYTVVIGLLG